MRHTCEWQAGDMKQQCGQPAVGCWHLDGVLWKHLCANHYDMYAAAKSVCESAGFDFPFTAQ